MPKITKTYYAKDRKEWRDWLEKHHATEPEIWLIYYKKASGMPRVPYNDAVEEALCFGWIDSTVKGVDDAKYAQRFSPRRNGSPWSEPNKERVRRLIKQGKMTAAGLVALGNALEAVEQEMATDILEVLRKDPEVWRNFQRFSKHYQTIRIGWIEGARHRPEEFQKRLRYFIRMTAQNKKYGMIQD